MLEQHPQQLGVRVHRTPAVRKASMAGKLRSGVKSRMRIGRRLDCAGMSEETMSTSPRQPESKSDSELRAELARQKKEVLRLRDLLISKDAELGAAKGRLAELDDRSQRIAGVAARIESRVPGLGRLVGTALRMLRSQRR